MKRAFGVCLIFLGIGLILNSTLSFTGAVTLNLSNSGNYFLSVFGLTFLIGGLGILLTGSLEEELNPQGIKIIRSQRFRKDIKKQNRGKIDKAISEIGSGLGHEHPLTKEPRLHGKYTIKIGRGGRIVFSYDKNKSTAVLERYEPAHEY